MNHYSSNCSIHCVIPPHMVDALTLRGNDAQRKLAKAISSEAERVRIARASVASGASAIAAHGLTAFAATAGGPHREVYDAKKKASLPGKIARAEGDAPTGDVAVDEAFDGAGDTYEFFRKSYGRDSLDGNGLPLISSVHYRSGYNNAFWDGAQMAYGDGDGVLFQRFTSSLSVIGHELSHGVVTFSGGLVYSHQSGALNEHVADVFGCLVVQRKLKQEASKADWLVGSEILGPSISGEALRSMKAPGTAYNDPLLGKDPQPYHMRDFLVTNEDNGGVHINSGIPNHAFYLLAQLLGGKAWNRAGQIWYDALQSLNNPHATFTAWAEETKAAARNRYGKGSLEEVYTSRCWRLVGVL